jgi:hypothetical protein
MNHFWIEPIILSPSFPTRDKLDESMRNGKKKILTIASLQAATKSNGRNKSFNNRDVYVSIVSKNARSFASLGVWFTFRKAAIETNINPTPNRVNTKNDDKRRRYNIIIII